MHHLGAFFNKHSRLFTQNKAIEECLPKSNCGDADMEESVIFFLIGLLLGYLIKLNHTSVPKDDGLPQKIEDLERQMQYYKKLTRNLSTENQEIRAQIRDQLPEPQKA